MNIKQVITIMHINIRIVDNHVRLSATYPKRKHLITKLMVTIQIPNIKVRLIISIIKITGIKNPKRPILHRIHVKIRTYAIPLLNSLNAKNA